MATALAWQYVVTGMFFAFGFVVAEGFLGESIVPLVLSVPLVVLLLAWSKARRRLASIRTGGADSTSDERLLAAADRWARPPGPLYLAFVTLVAGGFAWAGARPFFDWNAAVLPGSALLLGIVIWFVRWQLGAHAPETQRRRGGSAWFAVPAVLTLLAVASIFTDVAWKARWAMARPAFDRAVAESDGSARSIGGLPIDGVRRADGATWFAYGGREVLYFLSRSDTQIVYSPPGPAGRPPEAADGVDVDALGGGWYLVTIWSD